MRVKMAEKKKTVGAVRAPLRTRDDQRIADIRFWPSADIGYCAAANVRYWG